ncbi:MAG: methyltransferase domain-containing protein [Methylotenera sp.]|nr:methyltransferase domain-containing protein [Methylotenera sp.]
MKEFLSKRLVCPVSKMQLSLNNSLLSAPCGFQYSNNDFRVGLEFSKDWSDGQSEYEAFEKRWLNIVNNPEKLSELDNETADVYSEIKMHGDVLDVGGAYGFVIRQAGLDPNRYVSIDPIDMNWDRLREYEHVDAHYSVCETAARVRGFAEFLPFADASFDFVHMRSCIDHFANPSLALMEAFRVLRVGGGLVIGISLEGSYKKDQRGLKGLVKRMASNSPVLRHLIELIKHDHHMFHPTRDSLIELIEQNGFKVEKEVWQQAYHNVIYIQAKRLNQLKIG